MEKQQTQPFWVAFVFNMNSTIGASVFNMPYAFSKAGILFGAAMQFTAFIFSFFLSFQVLQAWCRVELIYQKKAKGAKIRPVPLLNILNNTKGDYLTEDQDSEQEEDSLVNSSSIEIQENHYEFCEMTQITMGKTASQVLCIFFFLHLFSGMASYCSLFATCLTSNIPLFNKDTCNIYKHEGFINECKYTYWTYLCLFTFIMMGSGFFHIIETKIWQTVACTMRILVLALVIITSLAAIIDGKELEDDSNLETDPKYFDISAYGRLASIVFLATIFQNTLPLTTSFMENKEKNMKSLVILIGVVSCSLFMAVSVLANYAVEDVEKLLLLNWREYTAGHSNENRPWWCYLVIYTIILLPAIDVSSSFPIICSNLVNNILNIYNHHKSDYVTIT